MGGQLRLEGAINEINENEINEIEINQLNQLNRMTQCGLRMTQCGLLMTQCGLRMAGASHHGTRKVLGGGPPVLYVHHLPNMVTSMSGIGWRPACSHRHPGGRLRQVALVLWSRLHVFVLHRF